MKILWIILSVFVLLILLAWLGLQIRPKSFAPIEQPASAIETMPLPANLPVPVERFYRQVYGDEIPVIHSAIISGHTIMRVNGIPFPGRFRFTHIAGQGYRHYIEATLYGNPIMKVNEHYLDGKGRLDLPFGIFEGEQTDSAANLGLWAESIWLPAILLTDERVRWEAVDETTAILVIPFQEREQTFVVRFDPETGLLAMMESMRYRDAEGGVEILWINQVRQWESVDGYLIPVVGTVTWLDQGKPWAIFEVEEFVYNTDVDDYIRATGP